MYGQLLVPLYKPWQMLATYGIVKPVPTQTFFLSGMLQTITYDYREPMPVYASHALKLADQTMMGGDERPARRMGRRFVGLLALALHLAPGA